jgi:hypothetical protein
MAFRITKHHPFVSTVTDQTVLKEYQHQEDTQVRRKEEADKQNSDTGSNIHAAKKAAGHSIKKVIGCQSDYY